MEHWIVYWIYFYDDFWPCFPQWGLGNSLKAVASIWTRYEFMVMGTSWHSLMIFVLFPKCCNENCMKINFNNFQWHSMYLNIDLVGFLTHSLMPSFPLLSNNVETIIFVCTTFLASLLREIKVQSEQTTQRPTCM